MSHDILFNQLSPPGYVVEDRIPRFGRSGVIENVERFERFELVLLVHVVLAHDLLKFGRSHFHG